MKAICFSETFVDIYYITWRQTTNGQNCLFVVLFSASKQMQGHLLKSAQDKPPSSAALTIEDSVIALHLDGIYAALLRASLDKS
jgi:hypothetical protein